ncbi:MAG: hypothetical protein ABFQ65_02805 [Nanoarchaeota archaeon]
MKTKKLFIVGGCSGIGKTTLITPDILYGKTKIHTGSIARKLNGEGLAEISKAIVNEIKKYESPFLDTHYAAINGITGHYKFYQGIEDEGLNELGGIEKKIFVLIDGAPEEVLERRLKDPRNRNKTYEQVVMDLNKNRENFNHYLKLTGAIGHIIKNGDLEKARKNLLQIFNEYGR